MTAYDCQHVCALRRRPESGTALRRARRQHRRVPAGCRSYAAFGVLNTDTRAPVTPDSLFHVGSVTKPCVATAIMILVEQAAIELDAPVARYLPELKLAGAPPRVTVRQLLSHTSGIDGDFFVDTGAGDDCLARYVERCSEIPLVCEPGAAYSYCNAGYCILARIAERVTGTVWDALLRQSLFTPLGMAQAFTLAADIADRPAAVGHMEADGQVKPIPAHVLPRALGPAGFTLMTTPAELVKLGRLLLDRGVASSRRRLLSEATVETMLAPAVALPDGAHWALGWKLERWSGELVVSHDGGASGQAANLWIVPRHRLIYAQCANGGRSAELHRELMGVLFAEYGLAEPVFPDPQEGAAVDLAPYEGRFENIGITLDFTREDGGLKLHGVPKQYDAPPVDLILRPLDRERFVTRMGGSSPIVMSFSQFDGDGVPRLFYAGRLHKRTG
ncbi:MAG: serine hydrolase domain-containing protein [Rhizomicrobium sp.]